VSRPNDLATKRDVADPRVSQPNEKEASKGEKMAGDDGFSRILVQPRPFPRIYEARWKPLRKVAEGVWSAKGNGNRLRHVIIILGIRTIREGGRRCTDISHHLVLHERLSTDETNIRVGGETAGTTKKQLTQITEFSGSPP